MFHNLIISSSGLNYQFLLREDEKYDCIGLGNGYQSDHPYNKDEIIQKTVSKYWTPIKQNHTFCQGCGYQFNKNN